MRDLRREAVREWTMVGCVELSGAWYGVLS